MGFFSDLAAEAIASHIQNKDKQDTMKSLVFVVGHNATINRETKKVIVNILKSLDESISLFACEQELDAIYMSLKNTSSKVFFDSILSTRIDREKIIAIYIYNLVAIRTLQELNILSPQQLYNLSLVKKHFSFSKQELVQCYNALAQMTGIDVDDLAEELEVLTGDEAMKKLASDYPNLIETDLKQTEIKNNTQITYEAKNSSSENIKENNVANEKEGMKSDSTSNSSKNEKVGVGLKLACFFIPMVGLILYFTWKKDSPSKAKTCGKYALISTVIVLFLNIFANM